MLAGSQRLICPAPWTSSFFGALSEVSFILRTLELFDRGAYSPHASLGPAMAIFNLPLPIEASTHSSPARSPDANVNSPMPERATTMELIGSLFARSHVFLSFLHEQHFRSMVGLLYDPRSSHGDAYNRFLPLFHHVVALGYLFCRPQHQDYGCKFVLGEAMKHFQAGQRLLDVTRCDDLISIQALLCGIVFLMSTSRIAPAHTLIGLASSSAMRLGLHCTTGDSPQMLPDEKHMRVLVFATVVKLDMYASLILDLPRFIQDELVDASVDALHATFGEGDQLGLSLEASIKHLELLRFTCSTRQAVFFNPATGQSVDMVDSKQLSRVEKDLHRWVKDVSVLLSRLGDSSEFAM